MEKDKWEADKRGDKESNEGGRRVEKYDARDDTTPKFYAT